MAIEPSRLRKVMGHFATGVTVVATEHDGGGVCGMTANAFTSVSLEPPLVLVCLDRGSNTYGCIRANRFFAASFLARDQHPLSHRFAQQREDKFDGVPYRLGMTGAPILEGSLGHVECEVLEEHPGGDHVIFVSRVLAAEVADGLPLVFFRGQYTTIAGEDVRGDSTRTVQDGAEPLPGEPEAPGRAEGPQTERG
jgi:flavin reductase (DIM6/NTAB) family NADH-FMN oxidoreductase RutF